MSDFPAEFNSIFQPKPSVQSGDNKGVKKVFNLPKIGVLNPPNISKTPLTDTLEIRKKDNPRMKYKLTSSEDKSYQLHKTYSLLIILFGTSALLNLLSKKK